MREVHICEHDDEMSILKRLRDLFRKTQLTIADPLFGKIVYSPRSKQWFAENLSLKGKLNEVDQISIVADESGPDESHREAFSRMLREYDHTIARIEQLLDEDYRKWCKLVRGELGGGDLTTVKGFPILETSLDVLNHVHFESIEVSGANKRRHPRSDVYLYICIGWEEEHNRAAFLEDGKLIDYDVV